MTITDYIPTTIPTAPVMAALREYNRTAERLEAFELAAANDSTSISKLWLRTGARIDHRRSTDKLAEVLSALLLTRCGARVEGSI